MHAETRDDAVAGALVLHLQHRALAGVVAVGERLGDDAVEARALEAREPVGRDVAIACRGRDVERRRAPLDHASRARRAVRANGTSSSESSPSARRSNATYDAGISTASLLHARLGRMLTQLQRVEVEAAFVGDDELAVEHDPVGELFEQRLAQLGEVAQQRLLVARLEIEVVAVAEHDAAEAVPLRLVADVARRRQLTRELGEHRLERRTHGKGHAPHRSRQIRRRSEAQRASWWRLESCSLRSTDDTWVSTVLAEIPRSRATSLYA